VLKRVLDLLVAIVGLALLLPWLVLIAALIKLDTPGPVFFRQERVGLHGRVFRIFKFRTMTMDGGDSGPLVTATGDARVTRVGAVLRRHKLDELPQLIDVLRGTMSLVGPRPEVPRYLEHYPLQWRERLLSVKPGITDFASIRYHDEADKLARADDPEREYVQVVLPTKLRYALQYVEEPTIVNDLRVIGQTIRTIALPSVRLPRSVAAMNHSKVWLKLDQAMSRLHRNNRRWAMLADAAIVLACWHLTYLFRLGVERWQPGRAWYDDWVSLGVAASYLACMAMMGVPRGPWRFFGFDDAKRIAAACAVAGAFSAATIMMLQLSAVARAVLLLHPLFCMLGLSLARMTWRMVAEHARAVAQGAECEPKHAIVLGAGEAGRRLIEAIQGRDGWTVLTLLDDDPALQRLRIAGVTVQGKIADITLPHILAGATHVIIAMPEASDPDRARAVMLARSTGLSVMSVPKPIEMQTRPSGITDAVTNLDSAT
jgi:lipopolysaccharide/colanic/teichoic acid biosynthesis glycosyltransferase